MAAAVRPQQFKLVLIKPSHYDDDGYLIQWFRSAIPSNTLAVMNGLALECKERRVLGDDVEIDISAFDETNTHVTVERIARQLAAGRGFVALGADPSRLPHQAHRRPINQLRRRPRLSLPVLVLHHHQCAGAKIPAAFR